MGELTKDAVLRTVHTFVLRAGRMTELFLQDGVFPLMNFL